MPACSISTASNFDREPAGMSPIDSLSAKSGGFGPAATNAYRVGAAFADAVTGDWTKWEKGVPSE
jgi:purine nucleoside permease